MGTMGIEEEIEEALSAERETGRIEFKREVDFSNTGDTCEIVKDIVAIANSGGGVILIGADNHGNPVDADLTSALQVDPAIITDKIHKYTNRQFERFELRPVKKEDAQLMAIWIGEAKKPIVFEKDGNYSENGHSRSAFRAGMIYYRHGAKSEPCTSEDLDDSFNRMLEEYRRRINEVFSIPLDEAVIAELGTFEEGRTPVYVHITDDVDSPAIAKIRADDTHPHRMTDVIEELNSRIDLDRELNQHDIICIRKIHGIEENQTFIHYPRHYSSPVYSDAFIEWVVSEYNKDLEFFKKARKEYSQLRRSG